MYLVKWKYWRTKLVTECCCHGAIYFGLNNNITTLTLPKSHGPRPLHGAEQTVACCIPRLGHSVVDSIISRLQGVIQTIPIQVSSPSNSRQGWLLIHKAPVSVLVWSGVVVVDLTHKVARRAFLPRGETLQLFHCTAANSLLTLYRLLHMWVMVKHSVCTAKWTLSVSVITSQATYI